MFLKLRKVHPNPTAKSASNYDLILPKIPVWSVPKCVPSKNDDEEDAMSAATKPAFLASRYAGLSELLLIPFVSTNLSNSSGPATMAPKRKFRFGSLVFFHLSPSSQEY
ncbi:hypothetical protein ACFX2H_039040 [Malus domestica]